MRRSDDGNRKRVDMRFPLTLLGEVDRLATRYRVTRTAVVLRAVILLLEVEHRNRTDGQPEAEDLDAIRVPT